MAQAPQKNKNRFICLCNSVKQGTIEDAITGGCHTLGRLFDTTTAGVGACGGSCQPTLSNMLESFAKTGQFPEDPRPAIASRRRPGKSVK